MEKWIFGARLENYNFLEEFTTEGFVEWGTKLTGIKKGDQVYIYIGAPVKKILFKTIVEEVFLNEDYVSNNEKAIASKKRYAKLVLEECFLGKKMNYLTYEKLCENGLNGSIRGQQSLSKIEKLEEYIRIVES